nr:hypothetical protein [Tenacibaculum sp. SG-28]
MNALLEEFDTAPFSKISEKDFTPAIKAAIGMAKKEIQDIVNSLEKPTFANTIVKLEEVGSKLDRITAIFFNLNAAETNPTIQKIAKEIAPWLSEFKNDITLNQTLFERIKKVYEQIKTLSLTAEEHTLLEKQYKSFSRNGANLKNSDKNKLREIDTKLANLALQFGENVLADTNDFELLLTDIKDLDGLPEGAKEAAKILAEQREKKGWIITLDYPSYIPFMTYAKNRTLRKN